MKSRSVLLSLGVAACLLAISLPSEAQPKDTLPETLPSGTSGGAGPAPDGQNQNGQAAAAAADAKPKGTMGGYAYDDKPRGGGTRSAGVAHGRYRASGPVVNIPGFEQTADGGSRLFVQLSQSVAVEERKAQGSITYVLKGASPRVWNNTNALVTVHFNTPVSRARLVPQGADLFFIVEMRAAASPTWKMNESQDKSAMLSIDFPKGDYLSASTAVAATPPGPGGAPARTGRGRRGGGQKQAPQQTPQQPPAPATLPPKTDATN